MKLFLRISIAAALTVTIIFTVIFACIKYTGLTSKPQKSDVIIVLGCQIWGKDPSWSLEYRLEKALELYNAGYSSNIIVSGGQGADEPTSESAVMKNWLVNHGVDSRIITEENKSTSTYENLLLSKEIMDKRGFKSALVVSNDFHIFRSLMLAKRLGIPASGSPAQTVSQFRLYYEAREILSVVKALVVSS